MSKTHIVSWNEDITCYARVKAKNKKQALEIAQDMSYKNPNLEIDLICANGFEVNEAVENE